MSKNAINHGGTEVTEKDKEEQIQIRDIMIDPDILNPTSSILPLRVLRASVVKIYSP